MSPNIYYVWFVTESGFIQTHQTTSDRVRSTERHVLRGLRETERMGVGAAMLVVELDGEERQVLKVSTKFNASASDRFRRYVEERAQSYRKKLPAEKKPKRLGSGKVSKGKPTKCR